MFDLTANDHNQDKYQEDVMNAHNLTFRPVPPLIKGMAESMRQRQLSKPAPQLNGMDLAVQRAQAQNAA